MSDEAGVLVADTEMLEDVDESPVDAEKEQDPPVEAPAPVDAEKEQDPPVEAPAPVDAEKEQDPPVEAPAPVDAEKEQDPPVEAPAPVDAEKEQDPPVEAPAPVDAEKEQDPPVEAPASVDAEKEQDPPVEAPAPTAAPKVEQPAELLKPAEPPPLEPPLEQANGMNTMNNPKMLAIAAIVISLLVGLTQIALVVKLGGSQRQVGLLEKTVEEAKKELLANDEQFKKQLSNELYEKANLEKEERKQVFIQETLNRIRSGHPEVRLRRTSSGDWSTIDKREEAISSPVVIEYLNEKLTKAKNFTTKKLELPPHSETPLCVLNPDNKGGTTVSFAPDFILPPNASKVKKNKK